MVDIPHINDEIAEQAYEKFSSSEYDDVREYVTALYNYDGNDKDFSDEWMNYQGDDLEPVSGVEVPSRVHPHTLSEWVTEDMPYELFDDYDDMHDEDIVSSWEHGAMVSLRGEEL